METPNLIPVPNKGLPAIPDIEKSSLDYAKDSSTSQKLSGRPKPIYYDDDILINIQDLETRDLKAKNKALKEELLKNYKLQRIAEKLVNDVQYATSRLKDAVLEFRKNQKLIEEEFSRDNII